MSPHPVRLPSEPALEARLAEIRARLKAATPGPWRRGAEDNGWMVNRADDMSHWGVRIATVHFYATDEDDDGIPNAEFIAHAPEDIAFLLDQLAALRVPAQEAPRPVVTLEQPEEVEATLIDVCQLLDGWHQDGTAWSAWDETVRQRVGKLLRAVYDQNQKRGIRATAYTSPSLPDDRVALSRREPQ